jgi:hypothetical protein
MMSSAEHTFPTIASCTEQGSQADDQSLDGHRVSVGTRNSAETRRAGANLGIWCLDHMIVFGEAHLRRILGAYAAYYRICRLL